jgi:hypothetical protein
MMPEFESTSWPDPPRAPKKVMVNFRLRPDLVAYLKAESRRCGLDCTAFVTRALDCFRTDYGLPLAARALVESDRDALGMEPHEYVLHALFQRLLDIRERGPGFDAPRACASDTLPRLR